MKHQKHFLFVCVRVRIDRPNHETEANVTKDAAGGNFYKYTKRTHIHKLDNEISSILIEKVCIPSYTTAFGFSLFYLCNGANEHPTHIFSYLINLCIGTL